MESDIAVSDDPASQEFEDDEESFFGRSFSKEELQRLEFCISQGLPLDNVLMDIKIARHPEMLVP